MSRSVTLTFCLKLFTKQRNAFIDSSKHYGYIIAIMRYEIILSPEAVEDLKQLDAASRTKVKDSIEVHLRYEPAKLSKSRIKRLQGLRYPQYRLRIDEMRVFYDIEGSTVEVLAIIPKSKVMEWLKKAGEEK